MTRLTFFLTIGLIVFPAVAMSQEDVWELQKSGVAASLRGLCAVSETCCWASGAKGTVIRTVDGGKSWRAVGPPNAEAADFRDIQVWDESTAVIMSAGDVDRLYRTEDGGISWTVVYEHPDPLAFFDGMSFDPTGKYGWLMGDPINGKVHLLMTDDAGKNWRQLSAASSPSVADGVAAFAASGTHLLCPAKETVFIGLGGANVKSVEPHHAAVLITTNSGLELQNVNVPIRASQSAGVFSITSFAPESPRLIVVGGDYLKPAQNTDNVALSDDSGRSWRLPKTSRPDGFRSVVVAVAQDDGNSLVIATGPSGTDQSKDGGESWTRVSSIGFHTLSFVSPAVGWAAGSDGRVARWRSAR
ncbi:MAG: oxidoreductase [Fuerstia sp.]|nr:oxidoreductase [Fuerstiella sp.]